MSEAVGGGWIHVVDVDDGVLLLPDVESHGKILDVSDVEVVLSDVSCEKKLREHGCKDYLIL